MSLLPTILLETLVCPEDHGELWLVADDEPFMYNPRLQRRYPIREGVPVMLVNEAGTVSDDVAAVLHDRYARDEFTVVGRVS